MWLHGQRYPIFWTPNAKQAGKNVLEIFHQLFNTYCIHTVPQYGLATYCRAPSPFMVQPLHDEKTLKQNSYKYSLMLHDEKTLKQNSYKYSLMYAYAVGLRPEVIQSSWHKKKSPAGLCGGMCCTVLCTTTVMYSNHKIWKNCFKVHLVAPCSVLQNTTLCTAHICIQFLCTCMLPPVNLHILMYEPLQGTSNTKISCMVHGTGTLQCIHMAYSDKENAFKNLSWTQSEIVTDNLFKSSN